jgi:hypothetical protein
MLLSQRIEVKEGLLMTPRKISAAGPIGTVTAPYLPSASEAALLLLLLAESKETELGKEKKITRFRVSEGTLKRVCLRARITSGFLEELQEWLLVAGWALIFAGSTYALIRVTAVEGWTRLASKRIAAELESVKKGKFDFANQRYLLTAFDSTSQDDDTGDEDADDE